MEQVSYQFYKNLRMLGKVLSQRAAAGLGPKGTNLVKANSTDSKSTYSPNRSKHGGAKLRKLARLEQRQSEGLSHHTKNLAYPASQ